MRVCRIASWLNPISNWSQWKVTNSINAYTFIFPWLFYGDELVSALTNPKKRRYDICLKVFKPIEKFDHKLHHLRPNSQISLCKLRKYESAQTKTNRADGVLGDCVWNSLVTQSNLTVLYWWHPWTLFKMSIYTSFLNFTSHIQSVIRLVMLYLANVLPTYY